MHKDKSFAQRAVSRRSFLRGVGLAAAGAGVLAACAPAPAGEPEVAPIKVPEGPVTIDVTVNANFFLEPDSFDEAKVWTVHVPEFNATRDDIKIIVTPVSRDEYGPKMLLAAQTGDIADVVWFASQPLSLLSTGGVLLPLDDLAAGDSDFDLSLYHEAAMATLRYDTGSTTPFQGPLWGLGMLLNPGFSTLYWNADVFAAAGVDLPTEDATYDDLLVAALALTQDTNGDGDTDIWGFLYNTYSGHSIGNDSRTTVAFGGEVVSRDGTKALINSPESVSGFQYYYDLLWTHKVVPPREILSALGHYKEMHMAGQLAMYRNGPWGGMHFRLIPPEGEEGHVEAGGMPFPKGPSGRAGHFISVEAWGITKATEHPNEAWEVLKWVTDKESNIIRAKGTVMPPLRLDAMEDPEILSDPLIAMNTRAAQNAEVPYFAANGRDSEVNQLLGQELSGLDSGDLEPTQAFFDGLAVKIQEILDKPSA